MVRRMGIRNNIKKKLCITMEMMLRDPFHTKETLYCVLRLPSFLLYAGACEHNKRVGKISRFADASCSLLIIPSGNREKFHYLPSHPFHGVLSACICG